MKKIIALIAALTFCANSFAQNVFNNSIWSNATVLTTPSIGGVVIGTQGSGIYSGYTMVGGDDFNSLSIVNVTSPLANYFTTHVYDPGSRTVASPLEKSYDMDPYHTGSQDSNRGIAVGTADTMTVAGSILTLKAREANGGETAFINSRVIVGAMIHTGGYITVSAPCIVEALVSFTSGNPGGWHPTFWMQNSQPLMSLQGGSQGQLEFDFEGSSTHIGMNVNVHGNTTSPSNSATQLSPDIYGNGYHLLTYILTATSAKWYVDGTLKNTVGGDMTQTNTPYEILFTNHTFNSSYLGDTGVDLTAWATAGTTGASMLVDYYRVWTPTSNAATILQPLQNLPNIQVNYNTSMTYTVPSATSLWGSAITDYVQAVKKEDFEPGSSTEGGGTYGNNGSYLQFPPGLTWNSGTRVLTGVTTDLKPGRIHVTATPFISGGGASVAARGYIDVGPNITTTSLSGTHGTVYSHDLYPETPAGTLVPKVITCTGLPAGLSFSATTGLITGTPSSAGSSSVVIGVTNSSGQTASTTVPFTVS